MESKMIKLGELEVNDIFTFNGKIYKLAAKCDDYFRTSHHYKRGNKKGWSSQISTKETWKGTEVVKKIVC